MIIWFKNLWCHTRNNINTFRNSCIFSKDFRSDTSQSIPKKSWYRFEFNRRWDFVPFCKYSLRFSTDGSSGRIMSGFKNMSLPRLCCNSWKSSHVRWIFDTNNRINLSFQLNDIMQSRAIWKWIFMIHAFRLIWKISIESIPGKCLDIEF